MHHNTLAMSSSVNFSTNVMSLSLKSMVSLFIVDMIALLAGDGCQFGGGGAIKDSPSSETATANNK
jgi:hypothetical protein